MTAPAAMPSEEDVARLINGPHLPVPDGVGYTLEHLREIRWRSHTTEAERQQARNSARAVLALFAPILADSALFASRHETDLCQQALADRAAMEARALAAEAALAAERRTGLIKWHSSEEDGGPDCGMELDIGTGRSLYLGELAGHDDWQVAIIERDTITPIADVHDRATAQILIEAIAAAIRAQGE